MTPSQHEGRSAAASAIGPELPWYQRPNIATVALLIFLLAIGGSLPALRGSGRDLAHATNLLRFLKRFFPPDFSVSGQILEALLATIQIAVLATCFSILLAFPLAVAGAHTLSPRWLVAISRMIMNCIRTIPSLIWALIAVAVVGPYPLAGVLGLSFIASATSESSLATLSNPSIWRSLVACAPSARDEFKLSSMVSGLIRVP